MTASVRLSLLLAATISVASFAGAGCGTASSSNACLTIAMGMNALRSKAQSCPSLLARAAYNTAQCETTVGQCSQNELTLLNDISTCYAGNVLPCVPGRENAFLLAVDSCNSNASAVTQTCGNVFWQGAQGFSTNPTLGTSGGFGGLAAPTLDAGTTSDGQILLAWSSAPGVSYNIYYSTSTPVVIGGANKITGATSPEIFNQGLPQTTYYFALSVVTGTGESPLSNQVMAATVTPGQGSSSGVLSSVVATPGSNSFTLNWQTVSYATSYSVYIGNSPSLSQSNYTARVPTSGPPFQYTSAVNGQTYWVGVTAVVNGVEGPLSPITSVTPTAGGSGPLAAPQGLVATPGQSEITLSWTPEAGATSYSIYQSTGGAPVTTVGTPLIAYTTPFVVGGLTPITLYSFVVVASNGYSVSPASAVVTTSPW